MSTDSTPMTATVLKGHTVPICLAVSAIAFITVCLCLGTIWIAPSQLLGALWTSITHGGDASRDLYPLVHSIVLHIRLPRVLAAILAGGALAVAGAMSQGLFRNELASPDILGVSAGSSFAAVVSILTGLSLVHPLMTPIFSMGGALSVSVLIYTIARSVGQNGSLYLILCGLALSSLLGGLTMGLLLFAKEYQLSQFVFWTMGGLDGRVWEQVLWPALPLLLLVAVSIRQAKVLDVLGLGDLAAHGVGLNVQHSKARILLLVTLLTALSISIAGPIAFIGLMIPHILRLIIGPSHRRLIIYSFVIGALFLLFADLVGRWAIAPYEIKAGIIASVLGSSYLLYLIVRIQRKGVSL
ncbi:iron ABC transporter permease [Vibrio sp. qd031]|uniref:FecCD family ABC transporter permease n=1 Tax=Vibrio sp. qd031 TaxID=1603038 RepID=UPI001F5BBC11|nr:iron ABC transporter permease [Vibrio sp. qd031]